MDFRKQHKVFATGEQQDIFFDESAFVLVRTPDLKKGCQAGSGEHYVVALNSADRARDVKLDLRRTALEGCREFSGELGTSKTLSATDAELTITLAPKSALILSAR